ncbi:hypothetical protein Xcel_2632 [Xylanimonas cellulosilytica DSM 15894]|uniref:Uncharacterized protein n=1 Tax=Xylanimonas cellulosilytica (strain DSM 15894 / JCM 12276 / CECT 5975 / KCTC 9989 / LMG 20990 / NBRC 107835 / XIL07) TaxID=446471 RepID=D1BX78_XYLCX|nr:hypothetical protein [Xylanimonas cellulosilytica]ACZ31646.1 hypothetical protein Xcel_2632 [Xylanimonas cellulosilytica DSM 15894]
MIALLAATTPAPPPAELDTTTVTPGLVGFLVTFAVVLAAVGLFQLLTRSLRRATRNAQAQGLELSEPARVGRGVQLPVRAPEPTAPGVLDGGNPSGPAPSAGQGRVSQGGVSGDGGDGDARG